VDDGRAPGRPVRPHGRVATRAQGAAPGADRARALRLASIHEQANPAPCGGHSPSLRTPRCEGCSTIPCGATPQLLRPPPAGTPHAVGDRGCRGARAPRGGPWPGHRDARQVERPDLRPRPARVGHPAVEHTRAARFATRRCSLPCEPWASVPSVSPRCSTTWASLWMTGAHPPKTGWPASSNGLAPGIRGEVEAWQRMLHDGRPRARARDEATVVELHERRPPGAGELVGPLRPPARGHARRHRRRSGDQARVPAHEDPRRPTIVVRILQEERHGLSQPHSRASRSASRQTASPCRCARARSTR
jgi:hypothetical protein